MHTHEYAEFLLLVRGSVRHVIAGRDERLRAGDLALFRPWDQHRFCEPSVDCELINVAFAPELVESAASFFGLESDYADYCIADAPSVGRVPVAELDLFALGLLRSSEVYELRLGVAQAFVYATKTEEDDGDWLAQIRRSMRQPGNFVAGTSALRRLAPCSYEHLCRLFKQRFNERPTAFINRLRVEYAARLLGDGDTPVDSVAREVGFRSVPQFFAIFRKRFGMTPGAYRRRTMCDPL